MTRPKSSLLVVLALSAIVAALLFLVVPPLSALRSTHHAVTHPTPTEADVRRGFPELPLGAGEFRGVWSDADRGAWLFLYTAVERPEVVTEWAQRLRAAGWHLFTQPDGTLAGTKSAGQGRRQWRSELRARHVGNTVVAALAVTPPGAHAGSPNAPDQDAFAATKVWPRFDAEVARRQQARSGSED